MFNFSRWSSSEQVSGALKYTFNLVSHKTQPERIKDNLKTLRIWSLGEAARSKSTTQFLLSQNPSLQNSGRNPGFVEVNSKTSAGFKGDQLFALQFLPRDIQAPDSPCSFELPIVSLCTRHTKSPMNCSETSSFHCIRGS